MLFYLNSVYIISLKVSYLLLESLNIFFKNGTKNFGDLKTTIFI